MTLNGFVINKTIRNFANNYMSCESGFRYNSTRIGIFSSYVVVYRIPTYFQNLFCAILVAVIHW